MAVEQVGIKATVENVSGFSSALNAMIAKIVALGASADTASMKSASGFARFGTQISNLGTAYSRAQTAASKFAEQELLSVQRVNQARAKTRIDRSKASVAVKAEPDKIAVFASKAAQASSNAASAATKAAATVSISNNRIVQSATNAATATAVGANKIAASASYAAASATKAATAIIVGNNQAAMSATRLATAQKVGAQQVIQANNATKASAAQLAATQVSAHNQIKQSNAQTSASMKEMSKQGNVAAKAIDAVGGSATKAKGPIGILGVAIGVMLGGLGTKLGSSIANAITGALGKALEVTAEFQAQQLGIMAMIGREFMRMGETAEVALGKATLYANEFMDVLGDIAIASPFLWKDVQYAFKMSMAFGNTAMEALGFTKAILDYAAGIGATNDMLERMAYNLSQIALEGKITQRDVRDLANAGFDLIEVIQTIGKSNGIAMNSVDEFNAALRSGLVTWEDFRKGIETVANNTFPGASERMSRSMKGLISTFKDIWALTLPKLVGPSLEEIVVRINKSLDGLKKLRESGNLEALGLMIGDVVNSSVTKITDFLGGIVGSVTGFIKNAFTWGSDLISNFAYGIISGARYLLETAFGFVNSIISYWLSPGSPPRVAPEVDQWGASMASEFVGGFAQAVGDLMASISIPTLSGWFHGFGEADWDVFDTIKSNLTAVLEQLGSTDAVGLTADLAKYLSDIATNGISTIDIIKRITEATGDYGADMALLVKYQLEYDAATKLVEAADKRITANETKLTEQVREYNKARRAGTPAKLLRDKALAIEATKDQIDADKLAKKQAEDNLTLLKKQMDMQEKIIKALLDFAKAQERAADAAERAGADAGEEGNLGREMFRVSDFSGMITKDIGAIRANLELQLKTMFAPLLEWFKSVKALWTVFTGYLTGTGLLLKQLWGQEIAPKLQEIGSIFRWWFVLWQKHGPKIVGNLNSLINSILYLGKSIVFWISDRAGGAYGVLINWLDRLGVWFDTHQDAINSAITGMRDAFDKVSEWVRGPGGVKVKDFLKLVWDYLTKGVERAVLLAGIFLKFATGDYAGAMKDIDDAIKDITTDLKDLGDKEFNIELLFSDGPGGQPSTASAVATAVKKGITDIGAGVQWAVNLLFKEGPLGEPSIASTIGGAAKKAVETAGSAISWAVDLLFVEQKNIKGTYAGNAAAAAASAVVNAAATGLEWVVDLLFKGEEGKDNALLTVVLQGLFDTMATLTKALAWNISIFFKRDGEGEPTGLAKTLASILKTITEWVEKEANVINVNFYAKWPNPADSFLKALSDSYGTIVKGTIDFLWKVITGASRGLTKMVFEGGGFGTFIGSLFGLSDEDLKRQRDEMQGQLDKLEPAKMPSWMSSTGEAIDSQWDYLMKVSNDKEKAKKIAKQIDGMFDSMLSDPIPEIKKTSAEIQVAIDGMYDSMLPADPPITTIGLQGAWDRFWKAMSDAAINGKGVVITEMDGANYIMANRQDTWQDTFLASWGAFTTGLTTGAAAVWGGAGTLVTTISTWYTQFLFDFDIWKITAIGKWNSFWTGISDWLANTWSAIVTTNWTGILDSILATLGQWWTDNTTALFDKGTEIMGSIIRGLTWAVSNMVGIGEAIVRGVFAGVLNELYERFPLIFQRPAGQAAGGVATGASNVIVGEAGAEAIIPLSSGRSIKMLARSLSAAMNMQVGMGSVSMPLGGMMGGGRSVVYNQNLYVNTTQQAVNVVQSFQSLKALYGTY